MTDFAVPSFSHKMFLSHYQDLLQELGLFSVHHREGIAQAEAAFGQMVLKLILDGEEFFIDEQSRPLAVYAYYQSKMHNQSSFWMTKEMRMHFINYLSRDFAREISRNPGRYPLIDLMLRIQVEVEVVERQFAAVEL
ncbi:hypothetical protein K2P47_03530 [Patescibacteria group bacterium]|nr:hypothetical protein [Patescibacteria group bacterium]